MESEAIIWEWFDKKNWVAYDCTTNQILEQAYSSGNDTLELDHGFFSSGPYIVDFTSMKQTNKRTKFIREMRRANASATTGLASWVCLVKKEWKPYDAESAKVLEAAYVQGATKTVLTQNGSSYEFDFTSMKQMNKQTGFEREARRIVSSKSNIPQNSSSQDTEIIMTKGGNRNSLMPRVAISLQIPKEKMQPCFGTINILLTGGRDLAEVGALGIDPFVVITTDFSPFVAKSEWKAKTTTPHWNQQFSLPINRFDMIGNIHFTVYNHNRLTKNDYLGRLDIALYDVVQKGDMQGWMPLNYEARKKNKKQATGHLNIRLVFVTKPMPAPSKIDLNMILHNDEMQTHQNMAREASIRQPPPPHLLSTSSLLWRGHLQNSNTDLVDTGGAGRKPTDRVATKQWAPEREVVVFADPNVVEGKNTQYVLADLLGEGGFAVVKRAINKKTGEKVAVKIIQKMIQADADAIALITREIQILHLVENVSCVSFIESRETNDSIYIVMEFVGGGDLLDAILEAAGFDEPRAARAIRDILRGLEYLHGTGICHRDMKPENILYHPELDVWKIADFGCATLFTADNPYMTEFEGTIQYMAPEILLGDKYTKSIDIWATGVIAYVSLSACFPWEGKTDAEVQESIMSYKIKFYSPEFDSVSPDAIGFILRLLEMNTDNRITIENALQHAWMKNHNLI